MPTYRETKPKPHLKLTKGEVNEFQPIVNKDCPRNLVVTFYDSKDRKYCSVVLFTNGHFTVEQDFGGNIRED